MRTKTAEFTIGKRPMDTRPQWTVSPTSETFWIHMIHRQKTNSDSFGTLTEFFSPNVLSWNPTICWIEATIISAKQTILKKSLKFPPELPINRYTLVNQQPKHKMHTIILNSDDAANIYLNAMLELINSDLKFNTVLDTAESLAELGADVKNLLSTAPSVAFTAFRDQFSSGNTMMFVSEADSKNLEIWNDRNEEFQIAIFRYDGQPVGLYGKDVLYW